jgi:hypothetical protein
MGSVPNTCHLHPVLNIQYMREVEVPGLDQVLGEADLQVSEGIEKPEKELTNSSKPRMNLKSS